MLRSKIRLIRSLLSLEDTHGLPSDLPKYAIKAFERKYKVKAENAPIVWTNTHPIYHNKPERGMTNTMMKLHVETQYYMGRTKKVVTYWPYVGCADKFSRLTFDRFEKQALPLAPANIAADILF
jgi:hypothetical protein